MISRTNEKSLWGQRRDGKKKELSDPGRSDKSAAAAALPRKYTLVSAARMSAAKAALAPRSRQTTLSFVPRSNNVRVITIDHEPEVIYVDADAVPAERKRPARPESDEVVIVAAPKRNKQAEDEDEDEDEVIIFE